LSPRSLGRTNRKTCGWAPIDETARGEPTLEVVLPEKVPLTELLPGLWIGESITVTDAVASFDGRRTVMV
jgi:hypothetical protein